GRHTRFSRDWSRRVLFRSKPCCTNLKSVLWTLLIFALFGFFALIISGKYDRYSAVNRSFQGEFTPEVTEQRWANLAEVKEAQAALVDESKLQAALEAIAKSPAKPAPTDQVVPGSPTFLKQSQQPAPAPEAPKAEAPKAEAPKAEAPKAEAPKAEAPKAEAPKAEAPKAEAPAPAQN